MSGTHAHGTGDRADLQIQPASVHASIAFPIPSDDLYLRGVNVSVVGRHG